MQVKIRQQIIKQAVDILRHLNDEVKIHFLKNGIHIRTIDTGNYELLVVNIPDFACDEYNLRDTGEIQLGIDLDKIRVFLKIFKKDDVFTINYDQEFDRLVIKQGHLTRTMGLIDTIGMQYPEIPKLDLKNKVVVDSKLFYTNLKGVIIDKHSEIYITIQDNKILLENHEEDENKKVKSVIDKDLDIYYYDGIPVVFKGDNVLKQVKKYKKFSEKIMIETTGNISVKITCSSNDLHVEYWYAIRMLEEINDMKIQKMGEQKKMVNAELEIKDLNIKNEVKETVRPICKPKRQPYNKYQWSQDMETVKKQIEEHMFNRETENDRIRKIVEYQGFVFFINIPKNETELSYIKIKNKDAAMIIQNVLPERYVLIAWYRWNTNGWIAQSVKKVS